MRKPRPHGRQSVETTFSPILVQMAHVRRDSRCAPYLPRERVRDHQVRSPHPAPGGDRLPQEMRNPTHDAQGSQKLHEGPPAA